MKLNELIFFLNFKKSSQLVKIRNDRRLDAQAVGKLVNWSGDQISQSKQLPPCRYIGHWPAKITRHAANSISRNRAAQKKMAAQIMNIQTYANEGLRYNWPLATSQTNCTKKKNGENE